VRAHGIAPQSSCSEEVFSDPFVTAWETSPTKPCVETRQRKFNQDNAILPPSAAQLVREGIMSPKTRFATILRFATKLSRESMDRDSTRPLVRRLPRPTLS
jgi:hypothetical protein